MFNDDLLIVTKKYNDVYTTCTQDEVESAMKRARESYENDLKLVTEHKRDYPESADYWQQQIEHYSAILNGGFEAISWKEYENRQRERWLNKPVKECTAKEFDDMLNVLPPMNWVRNERYSMFMVSECYTMTYYSQYLYDREKKKYYTVLADKFDKSTWLDNRLGLLQ